MKKACWQMLLGMLIMLILLGVECSAKADMPASQTGITCEFCGNGMRAKCGKYGSHLKCDNCGWLTHHFAGLDEANSPYHRWRYDQEKGVKECKDCGLTRSYKCNHSNYAVMDVRLEYNKNYSTSAHQVRAIETRKCDDCKKDLGEFAGEWMKENHYFSDGICRDCGYVQICQHANKTPHYDATIVLRVLSTTTTHHTVQTGYKMICDDCGKATGETGYFDAVTKAHTFVSGRCACGYSQPLGDVCQHYQVNDVYSHSTYHQNNDNYHRVTAVYNRTCKDCGTYLGQENGESKNEAHTFSNGKCTCGYTQSVGSTATPRPTATPNPTATPRPTTPSNEHRCEYSSETKKTYYKHNETQHWQYTEIKCHICGKGMYVRNPEGARENHSFVNGKCAVCGAKKKSCQHEMVKQGEPERVVTQYDSDDWMHVEFHRVEMIAYEVCKKCGYRAKCEEQELPNPKSHEFAGKTCNHCGYSKTEDYFALLASLPEGSNPMKNETVVDILWGEFADAGMSREEIKEICRLVEKAPATYRDLYLYSFFDYGMKIVKDPTDPDADTVYRPCREDPNGSFVDEDGKKYSVVNSVFIDYEEDGLLPATWFHETGHAIENNRYFDEDLSLWGTYLYNSREDTYQKMDNDVRTFVFRQATSDDHPFLARKWNSLTSDEQEQIYRSIIGSDVGYPEQYNPSTDTWTYDRVSLNSKLQDIHDELVGNMIASASLGSNETRNAYMVTDCLEGMTNGLVSIRENSEAMDAADGLWHWWNTTEVEGGHMQARPTYWYDGTGKPSMAQGSEAWAEYYSAMMTGNQNAINSNLYYFPETCAYFDTFAAEMLNHYKAQAGAH